MKVHALWSGGLDSTAMILKLLDRGATIQPLHVHYGQRAFKGEELARNRLTVEIKKLLLSGEDGNLLKPQYILADTPINKHALMTGHGPDWKKKGQEQWYMPCRNVLLLTLAAMQAQANGDRNIAIGSTHSSLAIQYPDCRRDFMASMQEVLSLTCQANGRGFLLIHTPLLDEPMNDAETLRFVNRWEHARRIKEPTTDRMNMKTGEYLPGLLVKAVFSCWRGPIKPCRKCTRCCERRGAWWDVFKTEGPYA